MSEHIENPLDDTYRQPADPAFQDAAMALARRASEIRAERGGQWAGHPDHPVRDWAHEVGAGDTRLGYWEWVAARDEGAA